VTDEGPQDSRMNAALYSEHWGTGERPDLEEERAFNRARMGVTYREVKGRRRADHPPIECPAPRVTAGFRGLVPCPWCGAKVRHASHVPVRIAAYEASDRFWTAAGDATAAAWRIIRDTLAGLGENTSRAAGAILIAAALLGYLAQQGWIPK